MTTTLPHLSATGTFHAETVVDFSAPVDLPATLGILQRGHGDPVIRVDAAQPAQVRKNQVSTPGAGAWLCQHLPGNSNGPAAAVTYRFDQLNESQVRIRLVGTVEQRLEDALHRATLILGLGDNWSGLELLLEALGDRTSTELASIRRRHPGVRLPATGALFDQLVTATLEQKVTHDQARYGWRNLVRQFGARPPSSAWLPAPEWMRLPVRAAQLRAIGSWRWHKLWVQPAQSKTILELARRQSAINRLGAETSCDGDDVAALAQRLCSIPGIGQWTVAEALQRSHAAADLPSVGDYHLAHHVGEALTGRRTDDDGMLRLLEPYAGHRQRVIRLLGLSGFRMQRFGPRLTPEDHRAR